MTDKEKLVELLKDVEAKGFWNYGTDCRTGEKGGHDMTPEDIADYLVENGVTFAKDTNVPSWIPISERLPEKGKKVLCSGPNGGIFIARTRYCAGRVLWDGRTRIGRRNVTHWMPLPNPPKEEI